MLQLTIPSCILAGTNLQSHAIDFCDIPHWYEYEYSMPPSALQQCIRSKCAVNPAMYVVHASLSIECSSIVVWYSLSDGNGGITSKDCTYVKRPYHPTERTTSQAALGIISPTCIFILPLLCRWTVVMYVNCGPGFNSSLMQVSSSHTCTSHRIASSYIQEVGKWMPLFGGGLPASYSPLK